jgi:hypothetical protein
MPNTFWQRPAWRRWSGLLLAPIVATAILALLNALFDLSGFLGMLVGGALAAGYAQHQANGWTRAGWWLGQSLLLVAGLVLAASLVPGMSVLILVAPAVPLVLAMESIAAIAVDEPWAYGIGGALFFGWLIATLFPLV